MLGAQNVCDRCRDAPVSAFSPHTPILSPLFLPLTPPLPPSPHCFYFFSPCLSSLQASILLLLFFLLLLPLAENLGDPSRAPFSRPFARLAAVASLWPCPAVLPKGGTGEAKGCLAAGPGRWWRSRQLALASKCPLLWQAERWGVGKLVLASWIYLRLNLWCGNNLGLKAKWSQELLTQIKSIYTLFAISIDTYAFPPCLSPPPSPNLSHHPSPFLTVHLWVPLPAGSTCALAFVFCPLQPLGPAQ